MRVLLIGNIVNDGSISMHVYLEDLTRNLKNVDSIHPKTKIPKFIFKNFIYPFIIPRGYDAYHIVDHSYSHLAHFLPKNKTIVTCHDLIPLRIKDSCTPRGRLLFRFYISGLKKAKYILSISKNTKKDLVELLGIPRKKIVTIPYGLDLRLFKTKNKEEIKKRFKWEGKIILLSIGSTYYKNTLRMLKSIKNIKNKHKNILFLKVGFFSEKEQKYIIKNNLKKLIMQKNNLSQTELNDSYNASDILFFPSLYEGFGRPPLEAMACGTPVLTSNTSSLPEIVGEAGIKVNPYSQDEIDFAVLTLIEDKMFANSLIKKGYENIKRFSWNKYSKKVEKVYKKIN